MNLNVTLDWKSFLALGGAVACVMLTSKLDTSAAANVSIVLVDALKSRAVAIK